MQHDDLKISHLVEAISLNNDKLAYKNLFVALYPKLKVFIMGFLKDVEISEEFAGDVMITLWRNRATLTEIKNIKVYAFVIAKNLCIDHLRKGNIHLVGLDNQTDFLSDFETPEKILVTKELEMKIQQCINSLPPQFKLVFHLIKEERMSYKEAANILNISVKTVDAQLVNALKRIAFLLKKEYNILR